MECAMVTVRVRRPCFSGLNIFSMKQGRLQVVLKCLNNVARPATLLTSFSGMRLTCDQASIAELPVRVKNLSTCPRAIVEIAGPAVAQWAVRMCAFYLLLQSGFCGPKLPSVADKSSPPWLQKELQAARSFLVGNAGKEKKSAVSTSKWHISTKGTLMRKLRVPSSKQGRQMLQGVCSILSEDDLFNEAGTHKGCRVRRESAHGESVCCANVRALFDELPTPHLEIEITVFPQGPITSAEYEKAAKLEAVLKRGQTI
eukprot:jgi/Mesen1/4093/ME000214S03277